jgi:hypothetical protein
VGALLCVQSPASTSAIAELVHLVRAEYLEMPGLSLTGPQVRRMWGLDSATCETVLGALLETKFLSRTRKGLFVVAAAAPSDQKPRVGLSPIGSPAFVGVR